MPHKTTPQIGGVSRLETPSPPLSTLLFQTMPPRGEKVVTKMRQRWPDVDIEVRAT
ncbi:MAG: hypothetical protein R3C01_14080 [Planctomycetaceae bacterium]